MKILFFFFSFLLLTQYGITQNNTAKIDSLKQLGRDSLIKLAIKKLNDPAFDPKAYDRVVVKADSASLIVTFDLSVRFITNKKCYYDAVFVALVGSGSGKSITGDCEEPEYYKPGVKQQKKIDFVFESINKENEIGNIPDKKLGYGSRMEITERATHYYVEFHSWSTFSHYKIEKVSGKIFDAAHKHYARSREEKSRYEIIK